LLAIDVGRNERTDPAEGLVGLHAGMQERLYDQASEMTSRKHKVRLK
jgi:hypothetical protein